MRNLHKASQLLQTEFSSLCETLQTDFDDHKSATRTLIDDYKSAYTADMVRMSEFTTNILLQHDRLEAQRPDFNQKSSSSSGCCMGFLSCFRTTPAKAQNARMEVVRNSFWDQKSSTAAQPSQLIFEHQQIIAELERKMAQLKAATTTGGLFGSGGSGGGGGGLFGSGGSGGGGLFGSGGLGNQ